MLSLSSLFFSYHLFSYNRLSYLLFSYRLFSFLQSLLSLLLFPLLFSNCMNVGDDVEEGGNLLNAKITQLPECGEIDYTLLFSLFSLSLFSLSFISHSLLFQCLLSLSLSLSNQDPCTTRPRTETSPERLFPSTISPVL